MAGKHYFLLRRKVTGGVGFAAISAPDRIALTVFTATRNSTDKGERP
jgi:hypothetical protein